ncbi:putative transcriptional regulatory protein [Marinomonas sp. MED121]|uniref:ROK family protein n=1 Tax=Marinomonas sp. MED121 TaxID=314277 RepID=UPI0000690496|nr:ROK family transcriptional regulator [Marinomonas sp. MED121]EAQ64684.1 putative transcriptional regulatory protein [Marinomonas sp. MED121]
MLSPIKPLQFQLTESQRKVLSTIREQGTIARVKIATLTGFRTGTVTTICKELLSLQLIQETEKVKLARGQPAKPLSLSPYAAFSFGVAFHIARIELALSNFTGNIIERISLDYDESQPADTTIRAIALATDKLINKHRLHNARILGMGVSLPGPNLNDGKHVRTIPQMKHWQDVDLAEAFAAHMDWPVWIDNDCKVAAVGEYYSGQWPNCKDLILIEIGHGIGGAAIIDGKLHAGKNNNAGEIGVFFKQSNKPKPCIRKLIEELQDAGLDVTTLEDIPDVEHEIVKNWIIKSAKTLMPPLLLTLAWFGPDCIVIGGSSPTRISQALIKQMKLEAEWDKSFDYPMAELAPSRVGEQLSSYGASMYPIFQTLLL